MKKHVDKDEWYPVYGLSEPWGENDEDLVEVDEAFVERYEKALAEFDAVQKELAGLYR